MTNDHRAVGLLALGLGDPRRERRARDARSHQGRVAGRARRGARVPGAVHAGRQPGGARRGGGGARRVACSSSTSGSSTSSATGARCSPPARRRAALPASSSTVVCATSTRWNASGSRCSARSIALRGASKTLPGAIGSRANVGDVDVEMGDWIVGDRDGVVVVPGGALDAVLAAGASVPQRSRPCSRPSAAGQTTVELLDLDPSPITRA